MDFREEYYLYHLALFYLKFSFKYICFPCCVSFNCCRI